MRVRHVAAGRAGVIADLQLEGFQLRPAGTFRARPTLYVGGESEPARALVADHGDVWFINGQPLDAVALERYLASKIETAGWTVVGEGGR